jgi:hypothetical protein
VVEVRRDRAATDRATDAADMLYGAPKDPDKR